MRNATLTTKNIRNLFSTFMKKVNKVIMTNNLKEIEP